MFANNRSSISVSRTLATALALAISTMLIAGPVSADEHGISFSNEVAPILTKLGCNGGGCHGKSTGRGGLKLSLFGFEAKEDYHAISRGSRGRRVFPASPDESLLLKKATMSVPHGGGRRMSVASPEYAVLRDWISASMPWEGKRSRELLRLVVEPESPVLNHNERLQLTVTAHYSDGDTRNVTRLTRFRSVSPSVAKIGDLGEVVSQQRTGEAAIVGLYQGLSAISRVVVPEVNPAPDTQQRLASFPISNFVDGHVRTKLRQLRVGPAAVCGDGEFLRRVTLQIAGRLPTRDETQSFLQDSDSEKRSRCVDRLLDSPDYADHFAQKWADLLRNKRRGQKSRVPGTIAFHRWIRNSLAANKPYDQFVREVITATGNVSVNPPSQWYAEVRYLDRYVDDTAQVFLGVRLGCARCHHHPFEQYSQTDYYGLAAFFARVGRKGGAGVAERRANETVYVKASGEVKHPATGLVVAPKGLGEQPMEIAPFEDPRRQLVDWMAKPNNPYFSRALVNRLWAHFFGRGLVEPMDDMRLTNPATMEPLLDELAASFVQREFDVKHVIRLICNSTTYQLSSHSEINNLDETQNHSRFYPQRLNAEVLLDALDQVTEVPTVYSGLPKGVRAIELPDEGYSNDFLKLFGRPQRESACECERSAAPSLSQSLFVMNNAFVLAKAASSKGYAGRLASDPRRDREKVTEIFLTAFSRLPEAKELKAALSYMESEKDKRKAYGNLLWALIHTKEFMYVH